MSQGASSYHMPDASGRKGDVLRVHWEVEIKTYRKKVVLLQCEEDATIKAAPQTGKVNYQALLSCVC